MFGSILKIVGILAAVGLVLVVGFIIKFRGVLRALLAGGAPTPSRITLRPIFDVSWGGKSKAKRDGEAFSGAGFQRAGFYEVPEMPGLELMAWAKPTERLYAVTYRHPAAGIWSDVVARYADETGRTASSAPSGGELDQPPWSLKDHEPGATGARLLEVVASWPADGREEANTTRFSTDFEEAYAREMAWRNERGGPTLEEIGRVAEAMGIDPEDGALEKAHSEQRRMTVRRLQDECVQTLSASGTVDTHGTPVAELSLLVIHDRMTRAEALAELGIVVELPEHIYDAHDGAENGQSSVVEWIREVIHALPERQALAYLGSVEDPVVADVWELREEA
jgi:hypothetical protein